MLKQLVFISEKLFTNKWSDERGYGYYNAGPFLPFRAREVTMSEKISPFPDIHKYKAHDSKQIR